VNFAVDRLVDVMAERVSGVLASSVLKGSAMVIEMLCQRVKSGEVSLADAVRKAAERIEANRALLLPKGSDFVDAEVVSVRPVLVPVEVSNDVPRTSLIPESQRPQQPSERRKIYEPRQ